MYFQIKNTLKHKYYHNIKHYLSLSLEPDKRAKKHEAQSIDNKETRKSDLTGFNKLK